MAEVPAPVGLTCCQYGGLRTPTNGVNADGCDALSDEAVAQCRDRNGAERTQVQSHACAEHRRRQAIAGSHAGVRRGQWTQWRHRRPPTLHGGARRLPRDAEQQKYSEIAALVSVTVGRERFRNAEPRFHTAWTQSGLDPYGLQISQKPAYFCNPTKINYFGRKAIWKTTLLRAGFLSKGGVLVELTVSMTEPKKAILRFIDSPKNRLPYVDFWIRLGV